uniref:MHC class I-like antigen recognition-like domain-containing protein n=1 Tax=Neolamprologus brichardi TaxID=32507 RepID=A0A3Q4H9S1_NEOBR
MKTLMILLLCHTSVFFLSSAHFLQRNGGCQWDENTGEVTGTAQFAYDGEGFLEFDLQKLTYRALKPEATIVQHQWNNNPGLIKVTEETLRRLCPQQLKLFLSHGKSSLQRKGKSELMNW